MPSLCPLAAEVDVSCSTVCASMACSPPAASCEVHHAVFCSWKRKPCTGGNRDASLPFRGFGSAGMAAGIAALVKEIDPSILIIGVEPTGANKMAISLKTGKRVSLDNVGPLPLPHPLCPCMLLHCLLRAMPGLTGACKMAISMKTGKRVSVESVCCCSCHTPSASVCWIPVLAAASLDGM